jgi:hypothetical protein
MDTDDLTPMAYVTLSLGYEACEPLRAEIGAAAAEFKTEDEFLHGIARFIEDILRDPEDYLNSWDLLDEIQQASFSERVRRVRDHITVTLKTPRAERGKPPFEK